MKNFYSKEAAIITTVCDGVVFAAILCCILNLMSVYARPTAIGLSILLLAYEIFAYISMTRTEFWARSEEKKKETHSYFVRMRIFFDVNVIFAFSAIYFAGDVKVVFYIIAGIALVYWLIYYVKFMLSR